MDLDEMARRVSVRLLADLRVGQIKVINIGVIRSELAKEDDCPTNFEQFERLVTRTTRLVVMAA
jgi:hypothetical protein